MKRGSLHYYVTNLYKRYNREISRILPLGIVECSDWDIVASCQEFLERSRLSDRLARSIANNILDYANRHCKF